MSSHQELGARLRVIVIPQMLPGDFYTPLAAQHVPQAVTCHHHELVLHHQVMHVDFRICNTCHTRIRLTGTIPRSTKLSNGCLSCALAQVYASMA